MICLSIKLENSKVKELSLKITNVNITHGTELTAVMAVGSIKEYGINQTSPYAPQLLPISPPSQHILQVASIRVQAYHTQASLNLIGQHR